MPNDHYRNPEPVPYATRLAVAPFLAAVEGYLRSGEEVPGLRLTLHRVMNREGQEYLQQISPYFPLSKEDKEGGVGRILAVTEGIIGLAYAVKKLVRTRAYSDEGTLLKNLRSDIQDVNDAKEIGSVATSYLAVPFLGPKKEVVLIFFADCKRPNFFADNDRIAAVTAMCRGFCGLFDTLQERPFPNLRNFQFPPGEPVGKKLSAYRRIQEELDEPEPPRFKKLNSFNYEASVS